MHNIDGGAQGLASPAGISHDVIPIVHNELKIQRRNLFASRAHTRSRPVEGGFLVSKLEICGLDSLKQCRSAGQTVGIDKYSIAFNLRQLESRRQKANNVP
jgi:hypothetical protein